MGAQSSALPPTIDDTAIWDAWLSQFRLPILNANLEVGTFQALSDGAYATEALAENADLVTLPCYQWNRGVLVPKGHALAKQRPLTLEALARHPIVTYDFAFTGRTAINAAFAAKGLEPNVVLSALDADVIKTYVELGMGVGIIARMAYDAEKDTAFELLDASHLFAASVTRLALRRGVILRGYVYDFITLFAPQYSRRAVDDAALEGGRATDGI